MAELKTKETKASVAAFLNKISDVQRRKDCQTVLELMQRATGEKPKMWGSSIVGFGRYKYKYASGREGEWLVIGFSPRKTDLTLYIMRGFEESEALLAKLGRCKTGKGCLYIKRLDDVEIPVLKKLISKSVAMMASKRV
ncbi:MAG TPA: DUF1801 domain-containing protein [Pyrinomonadaceae bacterium]|nr:DUF1801 domain-containing protein [Pyrinomonadaceae bacterium]